MLPHGLPGPGGGGALTWDAYARPPAPPLYTASVPPVGPYAPSPAAGVTEPWPGGLQAVQAAPGAPLAQLALQPLAGPAPATVAPSSIPTSVAFVDRGPGLAPQLVLAGAPLPAAAAAFAPRGYGLAPAPAAQPLWQQEASAKSIYYDPQASSAYYGGAPLLAHWPLCGRTLPEEATVPCSALLSS